MKERAGTAWNRNNSKCTRSKKKNRVSPVVIDINGFSRLHSLCLRLCSDVSGRRSQSVPKWPVMHGFLDFCFNYTHLGPNTRKTLIHAHTLRRLQYQWAGGVCAWIYSFACHCFDNLSPPDFTGTGRYIQPESETDGRRRPGALCHPKRIKKFRIRIRLPHNWVAGCECLGIWVPPEPLMANEKQI